MNNDVFPNKFKAALAAKQVQIGCWSALSNPISTEVLGLAGFDWLVLDGEHAPNDISTFIPQLMALKGSASLKGTRFGGGVFPAFAEREPAGLPVFDNTGSRAAAGLAFRYTEKHQEVQDAPFPSHGRRDDAVAFERSGFLGRSAAKGKGGAHGGTV